MVCVGITGGIGSGKSTVVDIWESLGAFVLNADNLAKNIMVNNEEIRRQIIEVFGEESYYEDGSLNRVHLADQAFRKGRVEELNDIVHPYIPEEVAKVINYAEKEGTEVFVFEAALLLQGVRPGYLDLIVLVLADEEKRVERVRERDGVAEELVYDRIDKQQNFDELTDRADIVIHNNGSLDELKRQATRIYRLISEGEI